jgi:hypothetical protein
LDILKPAQFESEGIQIISPTLLRLKQKKFSLGPSFAKRNTKAVIDFCRIVQAESLVIDHDSYFSIWLHYLQPQKSPKAEVPRKHPSSESSSAEVQACQNIEGVDLNFVQSCEAILVDLIGPIGKIILQRALDPSKPQSPLEVIESICRSIPNPEKAQLFRHQFIPPNPK